MLLLTLLKQSTKHKVLSSFYSSGALGVSLRLGGFICFCASGL
jgi:hypothetical protein